MPESTLAYVFPHLRNLVISLMAESAYYACSKQLLQLKDHGNSLSSISGQLLGYM